MQVKEELALVVRAQAGEREALAQLWDAITPKLYGYLCHILQERTLADDMVQQTWLKAMGALPRFQSRGVRFSAWLFAIARNECRQHWRENKHEIPLDPELPLASPSSLHAIVEEKLLVENALRALSVEDQDILRLRYLGDLSFQDIAAVLQISSVAARVRVHRALVRARATFETQ